MPLLVAVLALMPFAIVLSSNPAVAGTACANAVCSTTVQYVERFFPRWFTYEQSQFATNRLIAPRRVSPTYKAVVAVNDDTLYASSFVDVSSQPTVLTIPPTTATYSVLVLDAYGNIVSTSIPAARSGVYAFTAPGWTGILPAGVTKVPLNATFANVIVRADKSAHGVDESQAAAQFRKALLMQPLLAYSANPVAGATTVLPEAYFAFSFKKLADTEMTHRITAVLFLRQLQQAVHNRNTPPLTGGDTTLSDQFDSAFGNGVTVTPDTRNALIAGVRKSHTAIVENYLDHVIGGSRWINFTNIGDWGADNLDRDSITEYIQYGNAHTTAAYYQTFNDQAGHPLDGQYKHSYTLTFSKSQVPEATRFWSLTAYVPGTIELVPNAAHKYVVASYTPDLVSNPDGSITIHLSTTQPATNLANWLPIPDGPFNVMLRVYGPQGSVEDNTYVPPTITLDQ